MTRKDYELIAAALREARASDTTNTAAIAMHNETVRIVARNLSQGNPRFDMARFFVAAGVV